MKKTLIKIGLYLISLIIIIIVIISNNALKNENKRLLSNQDLLVSRNNVLVQEIKSYKVADSLNAIKVEALRLTLSEYKKYRFDDLALIKQLQIDRRDLQNVIKMQSETIDSLVTSLHDTIIISNELIDTVKKFSYKSEWTDIYGIIDNNFNTIAISINNRESLIIVESVKYKRFLGFLWKTKKIKSRDVNIVSKNPNTKIIGASFEVIEK